MNSPDTPPQPFLIPGKYYEITVNPDDSRQMIDKFQSAFQRDAPDPYTRYKKIVRNFDKMVQKMFLLDYYFVPEISEPKQSKEGKYTKFPRVHYHGIIYFTTYRQIGHFLLDYYNRFSQHYSIKLSDFRPKYWPLYIHKQQPLNKQLCDYFEIRYQIATISFRKSKLGKDLFKTYS